MIGRKNDIGLDIEVIRPIKKRPNLIVVRLSDGRQIVFGDGLPLNTDDFIAIVGGLVEVSVADANV